MNHYLIAFGWPNMFLLELHGEYYLFFRGELFGVIGNREKAVAKYLDVYLDAFNGIL